MTAEELRAELAYWTADGNWYMIWYFTERVRNWRKRKVNFEERIMLACSYIGKEAGGYGKVEAITIYGKNHYGDRISFCFKDGNEWSETSVSECLNEEEEK